MFDFMSSRSAGGASRLSRTTTLGLVVLLMTAAVGCGGDDPIKPSGSGGTGGTDAGGSGGTGGEAGSGGTGGVEKDVERVEVTPESLSMVMDETANLQAVAYTADDEVLPDVVVEWTSTDTQIAIVDADGIVKGLRPGIVAIVATVGDKSDSAAITVTEPTIDSVSLDSDFITVAVDATASVGLKLFDGDGNELADRAIPWVSADSSIATVDEWGTVTGVTPGSTSLSATFAGHTVEVEATVVLRFAEVAVGHAHTCALTALGGAWCWGNNTYGQLGTPVGDAGIEEFPVRVGPGLGLRFQMLHAGMDFTCGLTLSGDTWCWGDNSSNQLGRDSRDLRFSPVPVLLERPPYSAISTMGRGACGLDTDGIASCWGFNSDDFELGDPDNTEHSPVPLLVSAPVAGEAPLQFTVLRHGPFHSCGLTTSSRLYCWGYNSGGQIGDGTYDSAARPIEPLPGQTVRTFGLGGYRTCAVTADDTTYCWGGLYPVPTEQFAGDAFLPVSFAMGEGHSCALDAAGIAWCWGENGYGQLGRPGETSGDPAEVVGGIRFHKLASQRDHVCGLAHDEKVYCWGSLDGRIPWVEDRPMEVFQPELVPGQ